MAWTDRLWKPIKLRDGRVLTNLVDVRKLMTELPSDSRASEHWRQAQELVERAATSPSVLDDALAQTLRALRANGLN
jgi:hypothetical protein